MLKRSSLVIPGFLGTPAGITTTSAPFKASAVFSAPFRRCWKMGVDNVEKDFQNL